jgi:uncharacterized protein
LANPFAHVELVAMDVARAEAFYGRVFDWNFRNVSRGENPYVMLEVGEGTPGNFVKSPLAASNPFWLPYVRVDDIHKTLEAVQSHGGTVVMGPREEPGMATFAIFRDPMGAMLGVLQPVTP